MKSIPLFVMLGCVLSANMQVDAGQAASYFAEAAAACKAEGGRIWGRSLCGPMVFADPGGSTIATNQPEPKAKRPATLGFANAAVQWGGERWSTFIWQSIPADLAARRRLFLHELFHRIQPDLGLMVDEPNNEHLDTPDGRYWLQLEWRALSKALSSGGSDRAGAVRDALAFRLKRRAVFPTAAENERRLEINEGLADYTAYAGASASRSDAIAGVIAKLAQSEGAQTFVRSFAYGSAAAYGLLLDKWSPGWPRRIRSSDDLGSLLTIASELKPANDPDAATRQYNGVELRAQELTRETARVARVADFRRRFVDGPVLVMPKPASASFVSGGITPLGDAGVLYPSYRTTAEWGTLVANLALVSPARQTVTVPAPLDPRATELSGDGWTLTLAPGWTLQAAPRDGDFQLVRK
jgi:hypothetical protein